MSPMDVTCPAPYCQAEPGQRCTTKGSGYRKHPHEMRSHERNRVLAAQDRAERVAAAQALHDKAHAAEQMLPTFLHSP